jgi:hypothetical protein
MRIDTSPVLMPEAAADLNNSSKSSYYDVGLARKLGNVKAVPVPQFVDEPTNGEFRRRVRGANAPHIFTAPGWSYFVQFYFPADFGDPGYLVNNHFNNAC